MVTFLRIQKKDTKVGNQSQNDQEEVNSNFTGDVNCANTLQKPE